MAKFNLDNYETVEDRLKKYWEDNPTGRICTEVQHITDDGTCVTIRAEIYVWHEDVGLYCVATGIAQETKGQGGFANADAWMENCETSAIGRALANWKYQGSTKPRPSREEMSKVQVEKKPVKKPTKQEQEAMNKVVNEMVAEPTNTTGDVGKQLNQLLEAMIPDQALRQTIKGNAYNELVNNGIANKDIKTWTKENMDVFMTRAEDMFTAMGIDNEIEQVFGEVEEKPKIKNPNDAPTDKQLDKFNEAVVKSIDKGDDALAAKAKQALANGEITKGNVFDWINSDGDWSLKDGS